MNRPHRNASVPTRREFLAGSTVLAAGCATAPLVLAQRPVTDEIRFGIVGLRQRGRELRRALGLVKNSRVTMLCDVDADVLAKERGDIESGGDTVEAVRDMRRVFDSADVDAVMIATPNHWHVLASIWALQAGKHVYVEKPVSHSVWEGEQLARAARKYGLIVQAGTQNRSDSGRRGFEQWRATNDLGRVLWAHAVWYRIRTSIGKVDGPQPVPPSVDHELFCGPRAPLPVLRKSYHYDWHWQWPFGNGEVGNLGAHLVDDLRSLLGVGYPRRVMQAGARLAWDDDGETPNTSLTVFDYGDFPAVMELRNFPLGPGFPSGPTMRGRSSGVLVRYQRGSVFFTRANTSVYGDDGALIEQWRGDAGKEHLQNFAQAIRRNDPSRLRAPIEDSVKSAATCHLANLAWRTGREATLDEVRDAVGNVDAAHAVLDSLPAHLYANGVDVANLKLMLGGWLEVARDEPRFVGGPNADAANALLREDYRAPFVVPGEV